MYGTISIQFRKDDFATVRKEVRRVLRRARILADRSEVLTPATKGRDA
jgi:hypothetical protein